MTQRRQQFKVEIRQPSGERIASAQFFSAERAIGWLERRLQENPSLQGRFNGPAPTVEQWECLLPYHIEFGEAAPRQGAASAHRDRAFPIWGLAIILTVAAIAAALAMWRWA
jgi:hypothetical protein